MNIQTLKAEAIKIIKEFPDLADDVKDLFELAKTEIEEGGSESHECQLAINDMEELVKEYKEGTPG
jgi:hypothetical protein